MNGVGNAKAENNSRLILCICVCITVDTILNFGTNVDVDINEHVTYEQTFTHLKLLVTYTAQKLTILIAGSGIDTSLMAISLSSVTV